MFYWIQAETPQGELLSKGKVFVPPAGAAGYPPLAACALAPWFLSGCAIAGKDRRALPCNPQAFLKKA